jgi:hypothetical protein
MVLLMCRHEDGEQLKKLPEPAYSAIKRAVTVRTARVRTLHAHGRGDAALEIAVEDHMCVLRLLLLHDTLLHGSKGVCVAVEATYRVQRLTLQSRHPPHRVCSNAVAYGACPATHAW